MEGSIVHMSAGPTGGDLGELLQEFVNRVSHLQGKTLTILTEESVTLQQILLLRRLLQIRRSTPSELAERMRMSAPAVSQMIDRLFLCGLITRAEASEDRRRKNLAVTQKGRAVLQRVRKARAREYAAGTSMLSPKLRLELEELLRKALAELPEESQVIDSLTRVER
jgi:DNA-binding MarR family transcriptional regulator